MTERARDDGVAGDAAANAIGDLSLRVNRALEEDARRRRWVTRAFVVAASVPVIAAGVVFTFGQSDTDQTRALVASEARAVVASETRELEARVSERVAGNVAGELEAARELKALLPDVKSVTEAMPLVRETRAALTVVQGQVDDALARQGEIARAVEQATAASETARKDAKAAISRSGAATRDLEAQLASTRKELGRIGRIEASLGSIDAKLGETRQALTREVAKQVKAASGPRIDVRRVTQMESRLKGLADQSVRVSALEKEVARLPRASTDLSKVERSVAKLSRQIGAMDKRLVALERGGRVTPTDPSRELKALRAQIDSLNRTLSRRLSGIEKRLATLERRRQVIK